MPHLAEPALVHQIDDQLEFVHTLEVGHLFAVAGLNERFVPLFDEAGDAATEDGLLAEQIGFGFLAERRLDGARSGTANALCVREGLLLCVAGHVLIDRDEAGRPLVGLVVPPNEMARRFRGDKCHVDIVARLDLVIMDVEPVGEL